MNPFRRQGRDAAVGFAIIAVLIATAALILFIDRLIERAEPTYTVFVTFPEVPRLRTGDPVLLAGRPTGRITAIEFLEPVAPEEMRLVAAVELDVAHRELIRQDSEARTVRPRLLGRPVINILPGSPGVPILRQGDTLRIREALRPELFAIQVEAVLGMADTARAGLREVAGLARARADRLRRLEAEAQTLGAELDRFAEAWRDGVIADPEWRTRFAALRATADEIARRVTARDEALADAPARVVARIEEVRARLDGIEALLDPPMGTTPRLIHDPAVQDAVVRIRAHLDTLIAELRANPLRLFF